MLKVVTGWLESRKVMYGTLNAYAIRYSYLRSVMNDLCLPSDHRPTILTIF